MKPITSLADFLYRVEKDDRYKSVAIYAFKYSGYYNTGKGKGMSVNYESAMIWVDYMIEMQAPIFTWQRVTCRNIVNTLNEAMEKLPWFIDDKLRSPHTINEFTREMRLR